MDGFKDWVLGEMPITNWQTRGDWSRTAKRQYGFNKVDAGIIGSPKGVAKIHKKWSNTKENFDFYFVRTADAYKHVEVGEVDLKFVRETLKLDIEPDPDSITIIFTNNTAAEKIPMTAWTIAHRLGHAIRRDDNFDSYFSKEILKDFSKLLKDYYRVTPTVRQGDYYSGYSAPNEKALLALAHAVGTMRSARENNVRNFDEFKHELVAQYVTTGKIRFKPLQQGLTLSTRMNWGNPSHQRAFGDRFELADWNEELRGYAEKYEHYLDSIFMGLVGHIYVM